MGSPPSDDDSFEHVEKDSYDEDSAVFTDDEYEFVEAPVERHAAPAAANAQPVGGGVAANEDDDDGQAFPPPGPETIEGCDQGYHAETIVQLTPPQSAVAPPPAPNAHAKEEKTACPFRSRRVAAAPEAAMPALLYDLIDPWGLAELAAAQEAYGYGEAEEDDDATDEDDDDGLYGYYDFADFGRARRVKRSSGRRGRTKKATAMGRPRGEERLSHIAGNF